MIELMPAKIWVLNQLVISSFMSSATRNVCPDFRAAAEREMLKSSWSAACSTLCRVFSVHDFGVGECAGYGGYGDPCRFCHFAYSCFIHVDNSFAVC